MPSKLGGLSLPAAALFQPRKTEFFRFCLYPSRQAWVAELTLSRRFSPFFVVGPSDPSTKSFLRKNAKYRTRCVPKSTGGQNS